MSIIVLTLELLTRSMVNASDFEALGQLASNGDPCDVLLISMESHFARTASREVGSPFFDFSKYLPST